VLALYEALHAETRTTDPDTWRRNLEAVFDVDEFLHWLAVNTVIQNWDTYGRMAHNYYLYNDPTTGQLTWIPWDNNFALMSGMGGGRAGQGGTDSASLDHDSVDDNWPLIRYLMDDPVYHALYVSYVEQTINTVFVPEQMEETYTALHEMIAPYVVGENGEIEGYTYLNSEEAFDTALTELIQQAYERYQLAQDYLSSQASAR
jgi:spore coat protein CotH